MYFLAKQLKSGTLVAASLAVAGLPSNALGEESAPTAYPVSVHAKWYQLSDVSTAQSAKVERAEVQASSRRVRTFPTKSAGQASPETQRVASKAANPGVAQGNNLVAPTNESRWYNVSGSEDEAEHPESGETALVAPARLIPVEAKPLVPETGRDKHGQATGPFPQVSSRRRARPNDLKTLERIETPSPKRNLSAYISAGETAVATQTGPSRLVTEPLAFANRAAAGPIEAHERSPSKTLDKTTATNRSATTHTPPAPSTGAPEPISRGSVSDASEIAIDDRPRRRKVRHEPQVRAAKETLPTEEGDAQLETLISKMFPRSQVKITPQEDVLLVSGAVQSDWDAVRILSFVRSVRLIPVVDQLKVQP